LKLVEARDPSLAVSAWTMGLIHQEYGFNQYEMMVFEEYQEGLLLCLSLFFGVELVECGPFNRHQKAPFPGKMFEIDTLWKHLSIGI